MRIVRLTTLLAMTGFGLSSAVVRGDAPSGDDVFRRDNLIAWCIVPFDSQKRGPEERAAMLERLGFRHFAYDWRAEHVPTFDAEVVACKKHGVALDAWWFPSKLNDDARRILDVCRRHDIHPQLWVSGGGEATTSADEQRARVEQEANRIRLIAEAAAAQGMKVGLYNHGGWFGEPENQLAIIEALDLPNVGIVYNLHHGHEHLARFPELLERILPHLLVLNLNGMVPDGDRQGQKILQLGQGTLDLELLRAIRASGYRGPIGILGHTHDDAEARLQDNLDGLDWLLPQLDGRPAGRKPVPRTPVPGAKSQASASGRAATAAPASVSWRIDGRDEYRTRPLSVACRATFTSSAGYNILVACDTKPSGAHWELFTAPKTGALAAYLPGYEPDHVRTDERIVDGRPHEIAMAHAVDRVQLFVDGRLVADQAVDSRDRPIVPGELAIGRLIDKSLGFQGTIDFVQLWRSTRSFETKPGANLPQVDADTTGLWRFTDNAATEALDQSPGKNPAKRDGGEDARPRGRAPLPPSGAHLKPVDARLKTVLIARSPDDVYMGVKVDGAGVVFVGGREAVFVFEPISADRYAPRQELLRLPPDSIVMGLEFRGDDLYVLTANALYLVPDGRVRRANLQPQRILWGLPLDLHVSFHCLAWGPDGNLYLTHGDPLLQFGDWERPDHWGHWTLFCGRENRPLPYTGQGAVLRMKPDGSDVHVVARGLRGPVGLAFDRDGNLFTNDNDHESRADRYAPSRLLHVVEGIDFGWPRGWMASKSPDRFDLVEPVCDLGRGVPCDLTYYDRPLLADVAGDRWLMCRWDRSSVTSYQPKRLGATFIAAEETFAEGDENCRPVGIAADRSGRLFVTALYMTGNMAAPDCVSDLMMIVRADDSPPVLTAKRTASRVSPMLSEGLWSDDPFRRQLLIGELAQRASAIELQALLERDDEPTRLAAVLAVGRKLTVPDSHFVPPANLELFYPKGNSFFHRMQRFFGSDDEIDLADLGRVGSFTIAQWWKTCQHTAEHESLFALLVGALKDPSDRLRLQAAHFLFLLNDDRSASLVEQIRRDVQLDRLHAADEYPVERAWMIGPFVGADGSAAATKLETGQLDLSATYNERTWQQRLLAEPSAASDGAMYFHFRVVSGARQTALLVLKGAEASKLWQSETPVDGFDSDSSAGVRQWFVDIQPGSNDFLLRAEHAPSIDLRLRAPMPVEAVLPEKLDSSALAERLREAAAGGTAQAVPAEFAAIDWSRAATHGNAGEGRRLFGTLGCAKCHAIAPDQRAAGAASLFEAKRRFTVPHLVEAVLLPSRQVAELFRAQTFVTVDGRMITGLVTTETADALELLLPDATRSTLLRSQIEERSPTLLSPMPQGLVKTPQELEHLLAYLLSDKPKPP